MEEVLIVTQTEQSSFLAIIRSGIGQPVVSLPEKYDWNAIEALAKRHGLLGVLVDGIQKLPQNYRPPQLMWLRWIGEVQLEEEQYNRQWLASCQLTQLFYQNQIRTCVLKGIVVSECYPKPEHRVSADFDCFLVNENQNENEKDVWEKGNQLIEAAGCEVEKVFYKNSTFHLPGLIVENHRYMVPFRGNKTLRRLEVMLQGMIREIPAQGRNEDVRFEGTELWRPPVMVSALFLIEHAYSHFLHEGLTWRHVLDWVMFSRKHKAEINWSVFDALIDEFGFRKFYEVFNGISQDAFGNTYNSQLSTDSLLSTQNFKLKSLMLNDIWAPLDLHESVRGFKGKLALVGNTWRARRKYRYFTDMSWITALWIQVKGFLFEKNPKLD